MICRAGCFWFMTLLCGLFGVGISGTWAQAQGPERLVRSFQIRLADGVTSQDFRRSPATWRALRLRVRSGRIDIRKLTFLFWNGQRVVVNRRFPLANGRQTPWLVRSVPGRSLRRLVIEYARGPGPGAVLELRGLPGSRVVPPRGPAVTAGKPGDGAGTRVGRAEPRRPSPPSQSGRVGSGRVGSGQVAPGASAANKKADRPGRQAFNRNRFKGHGWRPKTYRYQRPTEKFGNRAARSVPRRRSAPSPSSPGSGSIGSSSTGGGGTARRAARPPAVPPPAPGAAPAATPSAPTGGSPPTADARSAPVAAVSVPACVAKNTCTAVRVFFGTNRKRDQAAEASAKRISFGGYRMQAQSVDKEIQLGRAVVTVPRVKRKAGTINRPGWLETGVRWVTGRSTDGDPDKHFIIYGEGYRLFTSEEAFLREIARYKEEAGRYKDHAFIFVHGYNTSFDLALMRTAQIAYDLGEPGEASEPGKPFGVPFMFSWPSAGGKLWSELLYAYDQESARFAIAHFKQFLRVVIDKTGARRVHLIAHSMGNVTMLNALAGLRDWAAGRVIIDQVILASPDVDVGEFRRLAGQVRPLVNGMTMYASSRDAAMQLSKRVHNGLPRAGDVVGVGPTVAAGLHSIDISSITQCYFCTGHSEYVDQRDLLNDITRLLREDRILPPHQRTPTLKPQQVSGFGDFWRYFGE